MSRDNRRTGGGAVRNQGREPDCYDTVFGSYLITPLTLLQIKSSNMYPTASVPYLSASFSWVYCASSVRFDVLNKLPWTSVKIFVNVKTPEILWNTDNWIALIETVLSL